METNVVAEHLVQEDPAPRKPLVLIKATEYRRRRSISRAKEYAELASGADVPRPIWQGGARYYIESEVQAYLRKIIATSRGEADAAICELPEPPPPEPRPEKCRSCGAPLVPTGKRGRPPVRCAACRGVTRPARRRVELK